MKRSECTPEAWEAYKKYQREWYQNRPLQERKKISERVVKQQRNNPTHAWRKAAWNRKRKYGITQEQYEAMVLQQKNCCALCEKLQTRTMNVDHDHATGKNRQLLCNWCNTFVGMFENNDPLIPRAVAYLERHGSLIAKG
jgi:Recombination endonuclease VII